MSKVDVTIGSGAATCACGAEVRDLPVLVRNGERRFMAKAQCPSCAAQEHLESTLARTPGATRVTLQDWLESLGVNTAKHGESTLENFDPSHAPSALEAARRLCSDVIRSKRHERVRGLYLVGEPDPAKPDWTGHGTGKSHLAVAIIRELREHRPDLRIVYDPADRLVWKVQSNYRPGGDIDALIEERAKADVYVLDDLGREKPTADALRVLCTILDEREARATVITSNAVPEDLGRRHGDSAEWSRVDSRLGDHVYQFVNVGGPDRRFRGAPE